MSDGFTVAAGGVAPSIFTCPKCNETIDSTSSACRFCGEKVDPDAAQKAAVLLAKVNQACSDASYMKSSAFAIPVFFVLRFLPFVSVLGLVGFDGLCLILPFWSLRWWIKYGSLASSDAEFLKARNTVKLVAAAITPLFILLVLGPLLIGFLPIFSQ